MELTPLERHTPPCRKKGGGNPNKNGVEWERGPSEKKLQKGKKETASEARPNNDQTEDCYRQKHMLAISEPQKYESTVIRTQAVRLVKTGPNI